jgi:hypothetical protein
VVTIDNVSIVPALDSEIPPVITITGDALVLHELDAAYVDAGATATDDQDGTVTVVPTGTVDVTTEGEYVITYTATDSDGNVAVKTRTVIVSAPISTNGWIYSTDGTPVGDNDIASGQDTWGTGAISEPTDQAYNPCLLVSNAGTGWGTALAFTGLNAGSISSYSTLNFKISSADWTTINIKFPGATTEQVNNIAFASGTDLLNGFFEMSIDLTQFGSFATVVEFAFLQDANTTEGHQTVGDFYITDIYFAP